jgi:hypothetical protein
MFEGEFTNFNGIVCPDQNGLHMEKLWFLCPYADANWVVLITIFKFCEEKVLGFTYIAPYCNFKAQFSRKRLKS